MLLAPLALALVGASCIDVRQLRKVEEERRIALEERDTQKGIALSRHLAWEARSMVRDSPDLALLLAVEACETDITAEGRAALLEALQVDSPMVLSLQSGAGPVRRMAFGAGGVLAFGGHEGDAAIRFWDMDSGKFIGDPVRPGILALAVSPDGTILASYSRDQLHFLDFQSRQPLHPPSEAGQGVDSLAFGAAGILAVGGLWGEIRLWDTKAGRPLTEPIQAHDQMTQSDGGGIFLSRDGGLNWSETRSGLTNTLVRCFAVSGGRLFAGTEYGGVFLSEDKGASWRKARSGLPEGTSVNCFAEDGTRLFAGTDEGVFVTEDGGASWEALNTGLPEDTNVECLAVSGENLFAGTRGEGIFRSLSNGSSWEAANTGLPEKNWPECFLVNEKNLFAGVSEIHTFENQDPVIEGLGVFLSRDSGASWKAANSGLPAYASVRSLARNGNFLFAGTRSNGTFLSMNDGTSWRAANSGLEEMAIECLAVYGNTLFAGTETGVFLSKDNGGTWEAENTGLPEFPSITCLAKIGAVLFAGSIGLGGSQSNGINALAFCPDGTTLLSGADDGTICRWQGKNLEPLGAPIIAHTAGVASLAFHPDGKTLASGGDEGEIRLWTWPEMKPAGLPIRAHTSTDYLAFTPDGVLLSGDIGGGTIRRWNGKTLASLGEPLDTRQGRVLSLAVRDDGVIATGGLDGSVKFWDFAAGNRLLKALPAEATYGAAISGDDQLVAAGEHGVLRCWSVRNRRLVWEAHAAEGGEIRRMAVSRSGRAAIGLDDGSVQFIDLIDGNLASPVRAHSGMISCLAFNPADDKLVTGVFIPGSLRILDAHTGDPLTSEVNAGLGNLWDIAISPDGKVVAAAGESGMIRLFDAADLQPITPPIRVHSWGMNFLAFSPDGRLAVAGGNLPSPNNIVQLRDGVTGRAIGPAIKTRAVSKLEFVSGGEILAGGGFDGTVRLWDGKTMQALGVLKGNEDYVVRYLKAGANGRIVASFDNGNAEIWEVNLPSWKKLARQIAGRELTPEERERFMGSKATGRAR